jgi:predicted TIM-barrel fold metal-dependent hydrolase
MTVTERASELHPALDGTWMVSSDSHIIEPPDLWEGRMPKDLAERGPKVVREADGGWWYIDGFKTMSFLGTQTGVRFEGDPDKLHTSAQFESVRPAAYEPAAYLVENEEDGIWGSVIYPSQGLVLFSVPVTDVVTAAMHAYNDWLADFCSHDTGRLKGIAMVNVDDPDTAAAELERCRNMGLSGALITVAPPAYAPFRSPIYGRLWAAASDLDMPLSLHTGTDRADPRLGRDGFRLDVKEVPPAMFINKDYQVRLAIGDLILSGVFEKYPKLKVGAVEQELAWVPFFLGQMDYTYTDRPARGPWHRFADKGMLPSHYWYSNCFASFQEDANGVRNRDVIGVDNIIWGSDYPHTEATFPRSKEIVSQIMRDVPAEEARKIVSENCARLYGFQVPPRQG